MKPLIHTLWLGALVSLPFAAPAASAHAQEAGKGGPPAKAEGMPMPGPGGMMGPMT